MKKDHFIVLIAGVAQPGMEDYLRSFLQRLAKESRQDDGCIIYNIHESLNNPGEFMLYSAWTSEKAFNEHNEKPAMQEFKKELAERMFTYETPKTYWTSLD